MSFGRAEAEVVAMYLSIGAGALALLWAVLSAKAARIALVTLTLASTLNYARWGTEVFGERIDAYDVIHYYLAAKYFDEVGYYHLYPAAIVVDHEHGPKSKKARTYRAQTAEGRYVGERPIREGLDRGREIREQRFTPERWAQFEHDFLHLQRQRKLGDGAWVDLLNDRGFNGTPAWLLVGRPLAKLFPVERIKWACHIDTILLIGALALVWRAFGLETCLWCVSFLTLTYSSRWPIISNAFLRYDWVAALLAAMALIRLGKPAAGGALGAYAALMRFFPAVWMTFPALKGLFGLLDRDKPLRERFDRKLLLLAAGFLAMAFVMEGLAVWRVGLDTAKAHADNIREHVKPEELSSRRTGLAIAMAHLSVKSKQMKGPTVKFRQTVKQQRRLRLAISAVLLLALGWGLRRARDDEAFGYGFIPFFLLSTASYYYLICRVTLIAAHASDLSRKRNRFGLGALLGIEAATFYVDQSFLGQRMQHTGSLSVMITLYILMMAVWWVVDPEGHGPRQRQFLATEPATGPAAERPAEG